MPDPDQPIAPEPREVPPPAPAKERDGRRGRAAGDERPPAAERKAIEATELPPPVVDLRIGERPSVQRGLRRPAWPWILGCVGAITLLGAIYWACIASPRFEVESQFAAQSEQGGAGSANLLQTLMLGGSAVGTDANRQLLAFIPSAACCLAVDQRLDLRRRWSADGIDPLSRLAPDASRETVLEFWRKRVRIRLDEATGLLVLNTDDFDAAGSLALAKAVMDESERLVNSLNRKMAEARSAMINHELLRAKTEAQQALRGLLEFQNAHSLPSATGTAEAATATSLGIETELLRERTGLADLLAVSGDESDLVMRARARIASLEKEATAARQKVAGKTTDGQPLLNELAAEQMQLQGLLTLRQEIYSRLLGASVEAQSQTTHNVLHLAVVVTPSLPEDAAYPRLVYNTVTLLVLLLLGAGIGWVLWATIREHA